MNWKTCCAHTQQDCVRLVSVSLGLWFHVGCDPLEESADMLREAVLWNVTLRLWAAAAAAAAEASDMQIGAGWFRRNATVTPSAAKMQGCSYHHGSTLRWVMKTFVETTDNMKMITHWQYQCLNSEYRVLFICVYESWERGARTAQISFTLQTKSGLNHLNLLMMKTLTKMPLTTWLQPLNPVTSAAGSNYFPNSDQ